MCGYYRSVLQTLKHTASKLKILTLTAALVSTTFLLALAIPSTAHADADCLPNGTFLSGTDPSWLNGTAVNVCNNGGVSTNDYGPSCVPVTGASGGQGCSAGYVWADDKWTCTELVNRLYLTKGWITANWKGNGGGSQGLIYYLPISLTDQLNDHISYVNPGDVITLNDGGLGHAAIINTIDSNSTLHIVNQNTTSSNLYSTASLQNGTSLSGGNAHYNSSWFGYTVQAIVHHPGKTIGDYNYDGTTDISLFRPSDGSWHVRNITDFSYGQTGDIPVPGDYNGDGVIEGAVFRPSTGYWYDRGGSSVVYGQSGDIPVPADWNGDGTTDIAVYRPSDGSWHIRNIADFSYGQSGDIPLVGDFDGNGVNEAAVYRPSAGYWYIRGGASIPYGYSTDIPVLATLNAALLKQVGLISGY